MSMSLHSLTLLEARPLSMIETGRKSSNEESFDWLSLGALKNYGKGHKLGGIKSGDIGGQSLLLSINTEKQLKSKSFDYVDICSGRAVIL
ncbi:hypothetical protein VNO78_08129 [Psophocarpus tetragonolobus]|uniref:Uncharacterized protein n=1 Tax=Psophocarpus tetragonolobus TaxID=3891 RepID=A0AAN9SVW5_PSOTE